MRMSAPESSGRIRAYMQFVAAVFYFFLAWVLARYVATRLASEQWFPLVEQALLVFFLLTGYAGLGFWLNRQMQPVSAQGLPRRSGWPIEAGMGLAAGWALAVTCVLPLTLVGGIAIRFSLGLSSWGWLFADAAFFAMAALAEEITFRGYGFQRFADAVGSVGAVLGFAVFYAIMQSLMPGASRASFAVSIALSFILSAAYLRTKALWVSWGLNFGWKASRGLLFGLAVSGVNSHSPVVQGDPMGPFWLTGGGYGLDGSWVAFVILLAALPVVFWITRNLDFRYNAPVIVPGGVPVDLDEVTLRQHAAATGPVAPSAPALVQILPATPLANQKQPNPLDKPQQQ
jgi:membrane protease YdiL (CAAX protease family)